MTSKCNVLCGFVLLTVAACAQPDPAAFSAVGSRAPSFRLANVSDQATVTSDSLIGEVVVLNFWSASCAQCIKEIEELKTIHAAGAVRVVGIVIDDDTRKANKLIASRQIDYPVLHGNEQVFTTYDGFSIPYTVVLDRDLTIRKKVYGSFTKADLDTIIQLLEEGPAPEVLSYRDPH